MKRIITTTCLLLVFHYSLIAQNTITLNSTHTGGSVSACEGIILQPGFSFTGNANKSLSLQIDRFECTVSAENPLEHIPNNYNISTGYAVGEIPITSTVSPTGSQTHTIPISVAPGINGLQPNLSLVYDSNAGNGMLGQGWGISGLSMINRTTKNRYYNGDVYPVEIKGDAFTLDGTRLIKTTSTSLYEAEFGNIFVKMENGAGHFSVLFPDGKTGIYGYPDKKDRLCYPLTRLTDPDGNYMTFSYTFENEQYYITRIDYGASGSNASHFAAVTFTYTTRPDVVTNFIAGKKLVGNRLLTGISSYSNNELVGSYTLAYHTQNVSLLKQIDYSAGGLSLNPLVFYYGAKVNESFNLSTVISAKHFSNLDPSKINICKGKFNVGNDDDAIAFYPKHPPYIWDGRKYITNYPADQDIIVCQDLGTSSDYGTGFLSMKTEEGFVELFAGDIDGIAGDELIKVHNSIVNGYDQIEIRVYTPSAINGLSYTGSFTFQLTKASQLSTKSFFLGDFCGQGKDQLLVFAPSQNSSGLDCFALSLLYNNNGDLYAGKPLQANLSNYTAESRIFPMQYNGDGKLDICCISSNGTTIYTLYNDFRSVASTSELTSAIFNSPHPRLVVGDINGDGNTDLLLSPGESGWRTREVQVPKDCCGDQDIRNSSLPAICRNCGEYVSEYVYKEESYYWDNGNTWTLFSSCGGQNFEKKTLSIVNNDQFDNFFLQDINHDGLADLVRCNNNDGKISIIFNRNGAFGTTVDLSTNFIEYGLVAVPTNLSMGYQYNTQILGLGRNGRIYKMAFNHDDGIRHLVHGVVNSLGVISKTEYKRINSNQSIVYTENYDRTSYGFPYSGYIGPMVVVAKNESYRDNIQLNAIDYFYRDAVIHTQGLGFCGFREIIASNQLKGNTILTTYDPLKRGMLVEEYTPGVSKVSYDYEIVNRGNKLLNINLKSKTVIDHLRGTTVSSSYQYDFYGNPTKEDISYGSGLSASTTISYKNEKTSSKNIVGLPLSITRTSSRSGSYWETKDEIEYTHTNHPTLPSKRVTAVRDSQADSYKQVADLRYEYDSFGNLAKQKVNRYSSADWLENEYQYSSNGRLLLKVIDPMGLGQEYTYNSAETQLKTSIDYKAKVTSYEFDKLGRATKTIYPDGTIATTSYEWAIGQVVGNTRPVYKVASTATSSPSSFIFYDGLNREVASSHQGFNGAMVYAEKIYDSFGRLSKISDPYKTGEAAMYTQTTYDGYDRPISIQQPNGGQISYTYEKMSGQNGGYTERATQAGITTAKTYNALGELTKVTDAGGTITYTYRADGQPGNTTAPGSVVTTFEYDEYGRQTKLIDPSAGTLTYSYDSNGYHSSIIKTRNQASITTTITNNKYGNPLIVQRPEFNTTYSYNSDQTIASIVSTNNTKQTFSYDDFGRLTSKTDEIGSEKLEQTYSYTGNRLASTSYKKQAGRLLKTLSYGYDSYGYPTTITLNNGVVVWRLNSQNGKGQTEKETLGNGIEQTYGYTPAGAPNWRKVAKQSTLLQHFSYTLDEPRGLLTARKDMINNKNETFAYDNVDRLWKYTDNTYKEIGYDNKGSITSKPDAGQLTYNVSGKPYAVGELSANTGSVPPRSQHITYSSFERPLTIAENDYHASFTYNASGQRMYMTINRNSLTELSRYYLSNCYELDVAANGTQTERLYLGGSAYNAPAVWIKQGTQEKILYIHRDHLGSITHLTSEAGLKVAEYSYDAWGRMRNPQTLEPYGPDAQPQLQLGRGYTGHEHLPMFGLVNMNARLYDPVLGRFLSPDPYVSFPDFSQSFNRYTYGLNNPLSYVDPDGENPFLIGLGIVVAFTYLKGVKDNGWQWNPFKWDWKNTTVVAGVSTDGNNATGYVGVGTGKDPNMIVGIGVDSKGNPQAVVGEPGNTTSINLSKPKQDKQQPTQVEINFDPMDMAMGVFGAGGTISTAAAGMRYTSSNLFREGYWRGVNGKYYSMPMLNSPSTQHYQGWLKNSHDVAKNASRIPRTVGRTVGHLTTAYSIYSFLDNPNWEDGLDAGFGVASMAYWPIGAIYGTGKILYGGQMRHVKFMHEQGLIPGKDDMMTMWKP